MANNENNSVFIARTTYSHAIAAEHRALLLQKSFYHIGDYESARLCDKLVEAARRHSDRERDTALASIVDNPAIG